MTIYQQNNDVSYQQEILERLSKNNREKCQWLREHPSEARQHNFVALQEDRLIGGAMGYIAYNWYVLDLFFVEEEQRGNGIGTELIRQIELLAKDKRLTGIRVETWDFQAKDFYTSLGFSLYGELNNCPPGSTIYFLQKSIN